MSTQLLEEDLDIMEQIDESHDFITINEEEDSSSEEVISDLQDNTLEFVTSYLGHSDIPIIHDKHMRDSQIMAWLQEYHAYPKDDVTASTHERKKFLRDCVILNTFFLLPYVLSKKQLPINIFEDVIQTIIINLLRAIENYNPSTNSKFSSYITGYIKDGIKITLHKEQFIYMPLHKRFQKKIKKKDGSVCIKPPEQLPEVVSLNESTCELTSSLDFTETCLYHNHETMLMEGTFVALPYTLKKDRRFCKKHLINVQDSVNTTHEDKILATLQMLLHPEHPLLSDLEKFCVIHYYGLFGNDQLTFNSLSELSTSFFPQKINKNILSRQTKEGWAKIQSYFKKLHISFNRAP